MVNPISILITVYHNYNMIHNDISLSWCHLERSIDRDDDSTFFELAENPQHPVRRGQQGWSKIYTIFPHFNKRDLVKLCST
jgi:hypothetical protein